MCKIVTGAPRQGLQELRPWLKDDMKTILPQPAYYAAIAEPGDSKEDMDRWLDERQAASERRDEEDLVLLLDHSVSVSQTHEIEHSWDLATSSRWYLALPERWMRDAPAEMRQEIMKRRVAKAAALGLPPEAVHGHPRIVPLADVLAKRAQREAARKIVAELSREDA